MLLKLTFNACYPNALYSVIIRTRFMCINLVLIFHSNYLVQVHVISFVPMI